MSLEYQIVPTTEAGSQRIQIALGGQDCAIDLYTKSLNAPIEDPGTIQAAPVQMATFLGSVADGLLTAVDVTGTILVGHVIAGAGMALPTYVAALGTGTGGVGTYVVTPSQTIPGQNELISMTASSPADPTYENVNPVFLDLYVSDVLVIGGVICHNGVRIVRDAYLGFVGDLAVIDTTGTLDPHGTPLRLPPPDLRNFWQRNLPLSLGGKLPVSGSPNKIPGMGTRWLLTYWPGLT